MEIEFDEQGKIKAMKGVCKAGDIKKHGLIKASEMAR